MSEIHWIKLKVGMFDDEKIQLIEAVPELGDAFLVIWIRLLALAGKINSNGFIFIAENIPYSPKQLSIIFRKSEEVVRAALKLFADLRMIEINDCNVIKISNWEKHQSIGMDRIRSLTKARVEKFRSKQKNCNVTVTQCNATDSDSDSDSDSDIRYIQWFDKFWDEYPRKVSKKKAKSIFLKICKNEETLQEMLTAISIQKQSEQWQKNNGQFIPYPTSWLNQERWEDELITAEVTYV